MAGMALAPTLSHLWAAAGGNAWSEVCSASGSRWVASAGAQFEGGGTDPQSAVRAHCPLCVLGAMLGPPPVPRAALPRFDTAARLPAPPAPALTLRHAWPHAQPRAPPAQA